MKIGILTAAFPKLSFEELAVWASDSGFEMLEVACWPAGQARERKYAGVVHIDVESLTPNKVKEIKDLLSRKRLGISALGYYPNPLHPDPEHRKHDVEHLKKVIAGAEKLGVSTVGTFVGRAWNKDCSGRNWQKDIDFNFEELMEVWPPIVRFAAERNVKIAIEHCPMLWPDTWPGGDNLPYSPALLRRMFKAIPDENFGLELDPSHLIWLHIDYLRFIYEFGNRIFHVHAKDMDIDKDMLYEDGILNAGFRWQKPSLPGMGLVDWKRLIGALYDVKYDYVLSIEHEDRNWEGTEEKVKRGFLLAKKTLEIACV